MLHEFLADNRSELIDRCRIKVLKRRAPRATPDELDHGIPRFLDQLTQLMRNDSLVASVHHDPSPQAQSSPTERQLASSAGMHGVELLHSDFTVSQVVHDYGDLCQSITELAEAQGQSINVQEFGLLNITLDNAIAEAVTEFSRQRDESRAAEGTREARERMGGFAHEMRNLLNTSILAIAAMKAGSVGFGGATAAALDRSLVGMRRLIDSTLANAQFENGAAGAPRQVIDLAPFILDAQVAATLEATSRGCGLSVLPVEAGIRVEADQYVLAGALANLLQNAFKFTRPNSHVVLRVRPMDERVLIEVQDECGGLPEGAVDQIFRPFAQRGGDRSGVGLGLSVSREGIEAGDGRLYVRDLPGNGCIFTIDLPRASVLPVGT